MNRLGGVPQPGPERLVPFGEHPLVVAVDPQQPDLVLLTAAAWAEALGVTLYAAYVDPQRATVEELPDGSVRHVEADPDVVDDAWRARAARLRENVARVVGPSGVAWEFRYLAGRPDRALTHLARAVDASAFVVGASRPRRGPELLSETLTARLVRHQHRPVLTVPVAVVDWRERPTT